MAFRDPHTDNITLTASEQALAVRERHGSKASWDELTREQRIEVTLAYVKRHPDAHPDRRQTGDAGPFTEEQIAAVIDAFRHCMPIAVRAELDKPLDEFREFRLRAELREMVLPMVQDEIDSRRELLVPPPIPPALLKRIDTLEETLVKIDSIERRISRHAEHLASIETRLKAANRE
jgi:hypothetical protein